MSGEWGNVRMGGHGRFTGRPMVIVDASEATLAMLTPAERMSVRNRVATFATSDPRPFLILDRPCECEGLCECEEAA